MERAQLDKGSYGYIERWKRKKLITIGVWAAFIVLMIGIPALVFHSRYNAFTIAGIVMVLPAARHVATYIAMAKFKSGSEKAYETIVQRVGISKGMILLADLILASETGHMVLDMVIISNGNIYGYAPSQKKTVENIEAALANVLADSDSHKHPLVNENFQEFEDMVIMLSANQSEVTEADEAIRDRLLTACI